MDSSSRPQISQSETKYDSSLNQVIGKLLIVPHLEFSPKEDTNQTQSLKSDQFNI